MKNRTDSTLELVDARTGVHRTIVRELRDLTSPRWSPAGDRLAFVALPAAEPESKEKPKAQLFVLRLDGGEPERITQAKSGVETFAWRPDGRGFAFLERDESPDKKRIDAHDDWFEITDEAWTARAGVMPAHLHAIDANGTGERQITHGTWSLEGPLAFAPSGATLFATRTPRALANHYRDRAIVAIDLANGGVRELTTGPRGAGSASVSPDGKFVAFSAERPGAFSQGEIYTMALDGRGERDRSLALDRNVRGVAFLPNGEMVVAANDVARRRLFAIGTGAPRALATGDVDVRGGATVSRDGTLAFVGSSATVPQELFVLAPGASAPHRLTSFNRATVGAHAFGNVRTIRWHGAGGYEPSGVLTEPVGMEPGKRYPLVLVIHGGPTATSTTGFGDFAQVLAGRGWLVFEPNYRGSDNLGHAFAQATVPGIASSPAADIESGLAAVIAGGNVDESRIAVSGWSEGGLLTSWLIAHDTRFRAAVSGAAVNDWTGYADLTDSQDFTPSFIGGSPWTSEAESPLTFASAVKTPTLVLTDAGDFRVPTPLAYEFYHAVRATGTPVSLVIVPVDGHFPSDPRHREEVYQRWIDWIATHFAA